MFKIEIVKELNNCPAYEKDVFKIVEGKFLEGEFVTVSINGAIAKRKVRYSREAGDLFITVKNSRYFYSEFED